MGLVNYSTLERWRRVLQRRRDSEAWLWRGVDPLGKLPRLTLDSASKFSKSNLPHAPLATIPSLSFLALEKPDNLQPAPPIPTPRPLPSHKR
jgi:hypothetical protein